MSSETTERIKAVLRSVPRGRVSSYGSVAQAAGLANGARQVVRILHSSAKSEALPWHRILRKDGSIALPKGGGFELQKALLEAEGVEVSGAGKVELARYAYEFETTSLRIAATRGGRKPKSRN
jgi:methylated-DNA-protein-cysteine methyltransferase-like protein